MLRVQPPRGVSSRDLGIPSGSTINLWDAVCLDHRLRRPARLGYPPLNYESRRIVVADVDDCVDRSHDAIGGVWRDPEVTEGHYGLGTIVLPVSFALRLL